LIAPVPATRSGQASAPVPAIRSEAAAASSAAVGQQPVQPGAPETDQAFTTVTVRRGDTLWALARRTYGGGRFWPTIFAANRDIIGDPNLIFPGQVLKLPKVAAPV